MGLDGFFGWCTNEKNFLFGKEVSMIKCNSLPVIQHLLIDFNSFIYSERKKLKKLPMEQINILKSLPFEERENVLIRNIIEKMFKLIEKIDPLISVGIFSEGTIPLARLNGVRRENYSKLFYEQRDREIPKDEEDLAKEAEPTIFEGKLYMGSDSQFMKKLFDQLLEEYNSYSFGELKVYLYGPNYAGEGEQKLFSHLRTHIRKGETVLIDGNDADLILLSFIYPEHYIFIHRTNELGNFETFIDISQLSFCYYSGICRLLHFIHPVIQQRILYDFVLLCLFAGNDYIYHLPGIIMRRGLNKLIDTYVDILRYKLEQKCIDPYFITRKNVTEINQDFLCKFLSSLDKNEQNNLIQFSKNETFFNSIKYNWSILKKEKYKKLLLSENDKYNYFSFNYSDVNWRNNYREKILNLSIHTDTSAEIDKICREYFESILFCVRAYFDDEINWHWYDELYVSPLTIDLFNYASRININTLTLPKGEPIHPVLSKIITNPRSKLDHLPEKISDLLRKPEFDRYYIEVDFMDKRNIFAWGKIKVTDIKLKVPFPQEIKNFFFDFFNQNKHLIYK